MPKIPLDECILLFQQIPGPAAIWCLLPWDNVHQHINILPSDKQAIYKYVQQLLGAGKIFTFFLDQEEAFQTIHETFPLPLRFRIYIIHSSCERGIISSHSI